MTRHAGEPRVIHAEWQAQICPCGSFLARARHDANLECPIELGWVGPGLTGRPMVLHESKPLKVVYAV